MHSHYTQIIVFLHLELSEAANGLNVCNKGQE